MIISKGRWALVSDGNPENIARFFRGIREQAVETKGIIVAPSNKRKGLRDAQLDWPGGWEIYTGGPLYSPNDAWFGLLWDDQCPESARWDAILVMQAQPWRVVTTLDGHHGDWRHAAIVWGMPCLLAGGGIKMDETLGDQLIQWSRQAAATQCWYLERGVQLPRKVGPPPNTTEQVDDPAIQEALRANMAQFGVKVVEPNWEGVSIMIATPSGSSRPEALYMLSLMATERDLQSLRVPYQISLERHNADIGLARSHIFSEFVRSKHSHLLMIDDDMTWETSALHRLVYADKPLIAVAGPKKRYPLVFAASHTDDFGRPIPMQIDENLGCAEVTSVGGAFMLIRRDCAEAIVAAYPELEYLGGDGKVCWGVFVQQVVDRNYYAEDFSFCQRWRKIGGKVYICHDVPLGHIGSHEFKGDLMSNALRGAQGFVPPP